jgi:sterol 3beta-glucosyltransferase
MIINTSWGGIEIKETIPDHVHIIGDAPYDWLFDKVCAVVHHGGSGTTHSALRFGLPQLIIPHIVDQFLWMKLVHKAGFGPLGFPIKKWNKDRINDAILALLQFV